MQTIVWNTELKTGNELIDWEHTQVVQLLNDSVSLARSGAEEKELISRLVEILGKLEQHFKSEENLASTTDHKHFEILKAQHDYMLYHLKTSIPQLIDKTNENISAKEMIIDLCGWYQNHICNEDKTLFG